MPDSDRRLAPASAYCSALKWNAVVNWNGSFRSEATIREFYPIASDEPAGLGGTDSGPNPVEQILAAYGNCLAVGYAANVTVAGITISNYSATSYLLDKLNSYHN